MNIIFTVNLKNYIFDRYHKLEFDRIFKLYFPQGSVTYSMYRCDRLWDNYNELILKDPYDYDHYQIPHEPMFRY